MENTLFKVTTNTFGIVLLKYSTADIQNCKVQ